MCGRSYKFKKLPGASGGKKVDVESEACIAGKNVRITPVPHTMPTRVQGVACSSAVPVAGRLVHLL